MTIGVISDTHIPERADSIPGGVLKAFRGVDLIIHAGDLTSFSVVEDLGRIAEVRAVQGNMDPAQIASVLPAKRIVKAEEVSIGVIHGGGHPDNIVDFVSRQFGKDVDVIVFGHSHRPFNERKNGVLFFNPGSPTDKIFAPYNGCGILQVKGNTCEGKIIKL
ncbi:MAG: metallophosphoesterase family protein [Candidatus Omnitrophota bacterium]